ncbi:unnamed protein product [Gongylonema pulchrum]|uniref:SPX domain-containing protein n=1 Tax=Gongylonema pulchrum TaxID=637853 RepID=A0A183DVS3_9BILA|nr:unnamed protein product [Gongylonema pulchrum]
MQKLQIAHDYYAKVDLINSFIERMNAHNTRFLRGVRLPIESYVGKLKDAKNNPLLQDIVETVNSFQEAMGGESVSVMSPRFFSIIPDRGRRHLLSPTMFSFQRDGLLSIPDLLKVCDSRQKADLNRQGYAYLSAEQLRLIYGEAAEDLQLDLDRYNQMSDAEKEEIIETKIRALALLSRRAAQRGHGTRFKRHHKQNETEHARLLIIGVFHTFETVAFSSYIGYGSALEILTLSPYAFVMEVLYPEAIGIRTLSPHAIGASVLSPIALTSMILSPSALRAEVGSHFVSVLPVQNFCNLLSHFTSAFWLNFFFFFG